MSYTLYTFQTPTGASYKKEGIMSDNDTDLSGTVETQSPAKIVYRPDELLALENYGILPADQELPDRSFYRFDAMVVMKMNNYLHNLNNSNGQRKSNKLNKKNNYNRYNNNHSYSTPSESIDDDDDNDTVPEWMEETDFKVDQDFKLYMKSGTHTIDDFEKEKQLFFSKAKLSNNLKKTTKPLELESTAPIRLDSEDPANNRDSELELKLKKQLEEPEILGPTEQEYFENLKKETIKQQQHEEQKLQNDKDQETQQNFKIGFGDLQFAMEVDARKQIDTNFFNSLLNKNSSIDDSNSDLNTNTGNKALQLDTPNSHSTTSVSNLASFSLSESSNRPSSQILPQDTSISKTSPGLANENNLLNTSHPPGLIPQASPQILSQTQHPQLPPGIQTQQQMHRLHQIQQMQRLQQIEQMQQLQRMHQAQSESQQQSQQQSQLQPQSQTQSSQQDQAQGQNRNQTQNQGPLPNFPIGALPNNLPPNTNPVGFMNMNVPPGLNQSFLQMNPNHLPPHILQQMANLNRNIPPGLNQGISHPPGMNPNLVMGINSANNLAHGFPPNLQQQQLQQQQLQQQQLQQQQLHQQQLQQQQLQQQQLQQQQLQQQQNQPNDNLDSHEVRRPLINNGLPNHVNPLNSQQIPVPSHLPPFLQQIPPTNLPPPDQLPSPFKEKFFQLQQMLFHFQKNGQTPPPELMQDMMKFHQMLEQKFGQEVNSSRSATPQPELTTP
jgi:hypothetical protein